MSKEEEFEFEKSEEMSIQLVGEYYRRLIGLMLTMVDATVPTENKKAAKDLTKQLIRTWFNDCSEGKRRYADLGNMGEEK